MEERCPAGAPFLRQQHRAPGGTEEQQQQMKQPIVRVADLRQQVYETLKERITAGGFSLDSRLQEISLAEDLGVSRTPVREALAMLVRDGLLVQATRGFMLPRFSTQDIAETTEIRLLLEPYAIRRMVEDHPFEVMRELGQAMRKVLQDSGPTDRYPQAHRAARQLLYDHIGNAQLSEAIRRFEDRVHFVRLTTLSDPESRHISWSGMVELAETIEAGRAEQAQALMRRQLMNALKAFLDLRTRAGIVPDMPELHSAAAAPSG